MKFKTIIRPLIFSYLVVSIVIEGRSQSIEVNKIDIGQSRFQIQLKYQHNDTLLVTTSAGCGIYPFSKLSSDTKIKAIGKLLKFVKDTSLCANKVGLYTNKYPLQERPTTKQYSLRIEALFFINFLGLSENALWYSPFPVLYDSSTKSEVTSELAIADIYASYQQWFERVSKTGFQFYPCPLSNSKYAWFGNLHPKKTLDSYPVWNYKSSCSYKMDLVK